MVVQDMAHRYKSSGFDETGLGRWSWVIVTGKQQCITRFVTVYCPVRSQGPSTVYTQQLAHLKVDPILKFWNDLADSIIKWQANGEQLILMGDWNEDVKGANLTKWMGLFAMREAITSKHHTAPPQHFIWVIMPLMGSLLVPVLRSLKQDTYHLGKFPETTEESGSMFTKALSWGIKWQTFQRQVQED